MKFILRFLVFLVGLGAFGYFGREAALPVWHRVAGVKVEGRVIGFLAGRSRPSVQPESTGVRKGKRRARRPVFRYPAAPGALDSLDGRASNGGFMLFGQFELNEKVTVVMAKGDPESGRIFSLNLIFTALLVALFGLFIMWMVVTRNG